MAEKMQTILIQKDKIAALTIDGQTMLATQDYVFKYKVQIITMMMC